MSNIINFIKEELKTINTLLVINKDAFLENYGIIQNQLDNNTRISMVLKNNAYGLGIKEVFHILDTTNCQDIFVADYLEAVELHGIIAKSNTKKNYNIYVFHGFLDSQLQSFYDLKLIPVCNSLNELIKWNNFAKSKATKCKVALHVETGINRLAIPMNEIEELANNPAKYLDGLDLIHIMAHFACSDIYQHPSIVAQYEKFEGIIALLPKAEYSLSASYGIFVDKKYHYDMVRPGISMYGGNPRPYDKNPMKPVIYLYSTMLQIKELKAGDCIGYGHSWCASRASKIAILPLGYADGLLRSSQENGFVYVENYKVKIVGRISMDLMAIDITDLDENLQKVGQAVELMGNNITLDNFASNGKTIHCEILNVLTRRYKKIFYGQAMDKIKA